MEFPIGMQEKTPEKEDTPIDETEGLSSEDAEKVAEQVITLKPDIIFMPHYLKGMNRLEAHRKSSCLYLYAIARMIAANIKEACEERKESAFSDEGRFLLAAKLLVYFYENLSDFHGASMAPNVYNLVPHTRDLRLEYGEIFRSTKGKQKLLLRVMKKNVKEETNPHFLAVKKESPFEFFVERFIAAEVEILAIKVEKQNLTEFLNPGNYAAWLIGRNPKPSIHFMSPS